MGMPVEGYGMDGFDIYKGKHIATWTTTMSTGMTTLEGECSEGGKVTTTWGEFDDPISGMHTMRTVTTHVDDNKFTEDVYLSMPDGNDFKMMEILYTRQ